jgi:hypothetical protein
METKYFIFLDNSGSMSTYYNNVKSNLKKLSDLDLTNRNLTFLTFDSDTKELPGSTFKDKLMNYKRPNGMTELKGVTICFRDYVFSAPVGQKICILFVTDGDVQDLSEITPILVDCAYTIASKKLSVYMSCVAINSSADMKAFSLLGLLNNFSVFQLVQSENGDGWGIQVLEKLKEVRDCETCIYKTESSDYIYSGVTVDSRISEKGVFNKTFLATLVQVFTICNFTPDSPFDEGRAGLAQTKNKIHKRCKFRLIEGNVNGFSLCKRLLKYVIDLGVNAKTRYIWSKLNTAKMVGDQDSIAIANEFMSTIADSVEVTTTEEHTDTTHNNVSTTNEHGVRIRFFVGSTKSFTSCLPIAIHNNQVVVQSGSSSELYLNIEVYHPTEPVYVEVVYANSKHTWFVPYGVSLIEGDTNYLMIADEKLDMSNNTNKEKIFNFLVKVVPSSMTYPIQTSVFTDSIDDTDSLKESRRSIAFPTVSRETREIDIVKRTRQINSDAHVLCFTFSFVYESDPDSWKAMLIKIPLLEVIFITNNCVICMENQPTIKLSCNHKCMCDTCYSRYIQQSKNCPMCRASFLT